jgi:hypothetical protein
MSHHCLCYIHNYLCNNFVFPKNIDKANWLFVFYHFYLNFFTSLIILLNIIHYNLVYFDIGDY